MYVIHCPSEVLRLFVFECLFIKGGKSHTCMWVDVRKMFLVQNAFNGQNSALFSQFNFNTFPVYCNSYIVN